MSKASFYVFLGQNDNIIQEDHIKLSTIIVDKIN